MVRLQKIGIIIGLKIAEKIFKNLLSPEDSGIWIRKIFQKFSRHRLKKAFWSLPLEVTQDFTWMPPNVDCSKK